MRFVLGIAIALATCTFQSEKCVRDAEGFVNFNIWLADYGYKSLDNNLLSFAVISNKAFQSPPQWNVASRERFFPQVIEEVHEVNRQMQITKKLAKEMGRNIEVGCFYVKKRGYKIVFSREKQEFMELKMEDLTEKERLEVYYQIGQYLLKLNSLGGFSSKLSSSHFSIGRKKNIEIFLSNFIFVEEKNENTKKKFCEESEDLENCFLKHTKNLFSNIIKSTEDSLTKLDKVSPTLKFLPEEAVNCINKIEDSQTSFGEVLEEIKRISRSEIPPGESILARRSIISRTKSKAKYEHEQSFMKAPVNFDQLKIGK